MHFDKENLVIILHGNYQYFHWFIYIYIYNTFTCRKIYLKFTCIFLKTIFYISVLK